MNRIFLRLHLSHANPVRVCGPAVGARFLFPFSAPSPSSPWRDGSCEGDALAVWRWHGAEEDVVDAIDNHGSNHAAAIWLRHGSFRTSNIIYYISSISRKLDAHCSSQGLFHTGIIIKQ